MGNRNERQGFMTITRRQAREWAVQMLTAADLNPPEDIESFLEQEWTLLASEDESGAAAKPGRRIRQFTEDRVRGVLQDLGSLDNELGSLLEKWDVYRLGTVERAVIRMGMWEMRCTSDVPEGAMGSSLGITCSTKRQ